MWRAGCYAGVKIRRDISDLDWPHGQLVIRVEWSQDRLCPWNEQLEEWFCLKKMARTLSFMGDQNIFSCCIEFVDARLWLLMVHEASTLHRSSR